MDSEERLLAKKALAYYCMQLKHKSTGPHKHNNYSWNAGACNNKFIGMMLAPITYHKNP